MNEGLHKEKIEKLIEEAKAEKRSAQHQLFETFGSKMLSICRYYISDLQYAEDVMIAGFHKIFIHIKSYRGEGSFEGWMRKIMTRESISFLRKNKGLLFVEKEELPDVSDDINLDNAFEKYDIDTIQTLIDQLPEGYKTVFLLYVLEDFSHKEIAAMLGITESTSKTQLFKAKNLLKKKFENLNNKKNESK